MTDSLVLGGKRHKEAKSAMLSCINDLHSRISSGLQDNDSRLVTIIQDVGSGKTHLTLHIKGLADLSNTSVISYTDLSQISPGLFKVCIMPYWQALMKKIFWTYGRLFYIS